MGFIGDVVTAPFKAVGNTVGSLVKGDIGGAIGGLLPGIGTALGGPLGGAAAGVLGSILGGGGSAGDILKGGGLGALGSILGGEAGLSGGASAGLGGLAALMLQEQAKQRQALEADLNARRGLLTDQLGFAQQQFNALAPAREGGMGALQQLFANPQGIFQTPQTPGSLAPNFPTANPQQPFPQLPQTSGFGGPASAPTANPQQQPLSLPQQPQQPSGFINALFDVTSLADRYRKQYQPDGPGLSGAMRGVANLVR